MKLSIVVPAYNVEKFLERCLNSIVEQIVNPENFEIIIVNDGSTDKTGIIADRFEKSYPNIKVLHQENKGQSVARNNGTKLATGDYIWYVDSDDWIEKGSVNTILNAAQSSSDILYCLKMKLVYEDGGEKISDESEKLKGTNGNILERHPYVASVLCIIKRDFITKCGICFYPGIFHEDLEFFPRLLYFSRSITFIDQPLYVAYRRSGSVTSTTSIKRAYDNLTVALSLSNFKKEHNIKDSWISFYICRACNNAFYIANEIKDEKYKFNIAFCKHRELIYNYFYAGGSRLFLQGLLMFIFSKFPVQVYYYLTKINKR